MKIKLLFISTVITIIIIEIAIKIFTWYYVKQVSNYYQKSKQKNNLNILAVVESTTFGLWVEDKSYPIQLKNMLNHFLNCACVSISIYSSPGGNTAGLLKNFPSKLIEYKPDIVLFMVGVNDKHYFAYNPDILFLEQIKLKGTFRKLFSEIITILNYSRLFRITKLTLSKIFFSDVTFRDLVEMTQYPENGSLSRQSFYQQNQSYILSSTKNNIQKMVDIAKLNNIIPVMLTYPSAGINYLIREIAKENQLLLVDNEKIFKNYNFDDLVLTQDNWHPNEKGYKLISQNIMDNLIENKLIKY